MFYVIDILYWVNIYNIWFYINIFGNQFCIIRFIQWGVWERCYKCILQFLFTLCSLYLLISEITEITELESSPPLRAVPMGTSERILILQASKNHSLNISI